MDLRVVVKEQTNHDKAIEGQKNQVPQGERSMKLERGTLRPTCAILPHWGALGRPLGPLGARLHWRPSLPASAQRSRITPQTPAFLVLYAGYLIN